jgi:hypothetical protein
MFLMVEAGEKILTEDRRRGWGVDLTIIINFKK